MKLNTFNADGKVKESFEIKGENVLCNNVVLSGEYNPHKVRLFLIGEQHSNSPIVALWASCLQDALDEATDSGFMSCFQVEESELNENEDWANDLTQLGNASEPHDLSYCWFKEISPNDFPLKLTIAFAEARGANADTLKYYA